MEERIKYITGKFANLQNVRRQYETLWDKCAELCAVDSKIYIFTEDGKVQQNIFDSTAANALQTFTASMKSLICPTNQTYHRLKITNPKIAENDEYRSYVEYANDLLFKFRYANGSGFSSEANLLLQSLGVVGHRAWLMEDRLQSGFLYRAIPVREIYAAANEFNKIDTIYREFEITAAQAVREFKHKTPQGIIAEAEKNPDRKFKFLHAVEPRSERKPKYKDSLNMPIASYNVWLDEDELIYESGYRVMPYQMPRYSPRDNSAYSHSPASQAFFDILSCNEMGKTFLRVGQLQANPALLTSLLSGASRAGSPGAIIKDGLTGDGKPRIVPMNYGGNLSITQEMQDKIRDAIDNAFLKHLFLSLAQTPQMTAQEVLERKAERGVLLAPQSEGVTSEWLFGNVMCELDALGARGLLDNVPDELFYDGSISLEMETPAVHMQNAGKIRGLYKTIEASMTLAQSDSSVLDVVDYNAAIREIAAYEGAPNKIIRSKQAESMLQQQKAEASQAQALLQAAPVISKSIKDLSNA